MLRNRNPAPVPVPSKATDIARPVGRSNTVPSIVSAEMTIHGDLQSAGDLQIEGTVIGEIEVSKLVIAEGGTVSGNIVAKDVRICGALNGSVRSVMVTLTSTARVVGDIYHEVLAIEAGGQLEGQSRRWVAGSPEPLLAAPTTEHRNGNGTYHGHDHSNGADHHPQN
jgi:cytoskeletal protein CcmA (bactofilin family)